MPSPNLFLRVLSFRAQIYTKHSDLQRFLSAYHHITAHPASLPAFTLPSLPLPSFPYHSYHSSHSFRRSAVFPRNPYSFRRSRKCSPRHRCLECHFRQKSPQCSFRRSAVFPRNPYSFLYPSASFRTGSDSRDLVPLRAVAVGITECRFRQSVSLRSISGQLCDQFCGLELPARRRVASA